MSIVGSVYHRKHFYKVTWERSSLLRTEIPWLKDEKHAYCIVGYRMPTAEEAEDFIGNAMYDLLFDRVCAVEEISKEEALRDFRMDDWRSQKAFGAKTHVVLDDLLLNAKKRACFAPVNELERDREWERG